MARPTVERCGGGTEGRPPPDPESAPPVSRDVLLQRPWGGSLEPPPAEDAVGRLRAPSSATWSLESSLVFRFGRGKKLVSRTNASSRGRSSRPQRSAGWRRPRASSGCGEGGVRRCPPSGPFSRALLTPAAASERLPGEPPPAPRDAAGADSRGPAQPSASRPAPRHVSSAAAKQVWSVSVCVRPASAPIGPRSASARAEDPEHARCGHRISGYAGGRAHHSACSGAGPRLILSLEVASSLDVCAATRTLGQTVGAWHGREASCPRITHNALLRGPLALSWGWGGRRCYFLLSPERLQAGEEDTRTRG